MGWGILHLGESDLTISHGGSNGKPQAHLLILPRKKMSVCILAHAHDPQTFYLDELSFRLLSVLEELNAGEEGDAISRMHGER